jgi:hypothetical protein
LHFGGAQDFQI